MKLLILLSVSCAFVSGRPQISFPGKVCDKPFNIIKLVKSVWNWKFHVVSFSFIQESAYRQAMQMQILLLAVEARSVIASEIELVNNWKWLYFVWHFTGGGGSGSNANANSFSLNIGGGGIGGLALPGISLSQSQAQVKLKSKLNHHCVLISDVFLLIRVNKCFQGCSDNYLNSIWNIHEREEENVS